MFRRAPGTGAETWTARRKKDNRDYEQKSLGAVATDYDYRDAAEAARKWDEEQTATGDSSDHKVLKWTVEKVCKEYIKAHKKTKANLDWERQVNIRVNNLLSLPTTNKPDRKPRTIASTTLGILQSGQISALQRELSASGMKSASVNRSMAPIVAALNWAMQEHGLKVNPLSQYKRQTVVNARRRRKFSMEDCSEVVSRAPESLKPILTCMFYTGCRPVGARRLKVGDIDLKEKKVWFRSLKGKANSEYSTYYTSLNPEAIKFFRKQIKGREADEYVFTQDNGNQWGERNLAKSFGAYRKKGKLDEWGTLYHFRHSVITHVLKAGMPSIQAAAEYGTSLEYLEKNYFERDDAKAMTFSPIMSAA